MNMKRFQRILNTDQSDWVVNHINYYPVTKTAVLVINHVGKDPGKFRQMFGTDGKFIQKQAAALIDLAQKHGPKVRPHIKQVAVDVKG